MKGVAVYPGRFEPMTLGHFDIMQRANDLFDHCIIAVADLPSGHWDNATRLTLVQESIKDLPNVEAALFSGLLVDFIDAHGITNIIRGLRNIDDFHYEYRMSVMNRQLSPTLETVFLMASPEVATISATLVRDIMERGGQIEPFVPSHVAEYYRAHHGT